MCAIELCSLKFVPRVQRPAAAWPSPGWAWGALPCLRGALLSRPAHWQCSQAGRRPAGGAAALTGSSSSCRSSADRCCTSAGQQGQGAAAAEGEQSYGGQVQHTVVVASTGWLSQQRWKLAAAGDGAAQLRAAEGGGGLAWMKGPCTLHCTKERMLPGRAKFPSFLVACSTAAGKAGGRGQRGSGAEEGSGMSRQLVRTVRRCMPSWLRGGGRLEGNRRQ